MKQKKPEWITDKQWKAVPSVRWWEDVEIRKKNIAKQKPQTIQEIEETLARLKK